MPRRSKRKQSKKAEATEDVAAEEIDQSTSQEESSTQDEEGSPSQKKAKLEPSKDEISSNQSNEDDKETEEVNQEAEEHEAEIKDQTETPENVASSESADPAPQAGHEGELITHDRDEQHETEPTGEAEELAARDNEKANTGDESMDTSVVEPVSQADNEEVLGEQSTTRGSSEPASQTESAEQQDNNEAMEVNPPAEKRVSEKEKKSEENNVKSNDTPDVKLVVKDQHADEEDDGSSSFVQIEKEPTIPYCYDDDSVEVPVDPEGDDGEVLIGNESPEFLKYWRAVLDNPQDFTNWTYLLQLVEQENKPSLARRAYNGFFKRYPLCYGYWKKFSELERRNGNYVRAQRILERGVRAIPLSIDLWVHTIDFYINHYKGPDAGQEKVRKVFERAGAAAGEEFRSEKLWNKYLKWVKETKVWNDVMALYDRVIRLPTQHYAVYFKDFKEFVHTHSPQDLIDVDEFEKTLEEVRDEIEKKEQEKKRKEEEKKKREKKDKDKESENNEDAKPNDDVPPGVEKDDRSRPPNEKELKAIGEKIISKKKKLYEATEVVVTKIWTYEEGVKRPYFHVKALERTQIKNWRDYLEAEMLKGEENHRRTILLFERCLIACALYEDFWLKYARYLMKTDPPKARGVYRRACDIHLPKKPTIHIHWAAFEEVQGNYEDAANILVNLEKTLPNLLMVKMRRIAVERRAGHIAEAEALLKGYLTSTDKVEERCFFTRKYAWFLTNVSKKVNAARQVLKDVISKTRGEVQLYKDLIGLEFYHGNEESFCSACDLALGSSDLSEESKFLFSQRKLEYLEDFGNDATLVQKTYDDHQKLYRSHKKKQQAAADSEQKKAKSEATSPTSGSKIETTAGARQTYSAKPTTNGNVTAQTTTPQVTAQAYQQANAGDATSLYYQNYWNYQQQKPDAQAQQQYQYGQWPQYSQAYYQQ